MAGIPTRTVNDMILYGFLLGGGVLFLLGSSIFIPALRGSGSTDNTALRNIQDQIDRLASNVTGKPININWVNPAPASSTRSPTVIVKSPSKTSSSRSTYKAPTPVKNISSPNCTSSNGYTIWKGNGCYNGKQVYNVAAEIKGLNNCAGARTVFLERYKCR